jgi:DNA invertase Pin-like site-specific DNA recombinase
MTPNTQVVSYLRVSTGKQGRSGLGLEAQREAVEEFLGSSGGELVQEFQEVESGRKSDRPQLSQALSLCRLRKAILVVAKLDRLARDAHFLLGLQRAGVEFVACDLPGANRLTVGILAMVAEEEARLTSARTRAALAAAKRRGVKLGRPNLTDPIRKLGTKASAQVRSELSRQWAMDMRPHLQEILSSNRPSLRALADRLNEIGLPTPRGGRWHATQVRRLLRQVAAAS